MEPAGFFWCDTRVKIGFVSLDHLRDWTGITRLIDRLAAEMVLRGHQAVIIAEKGKASAKIPVSALSYPHELIAIDTEGAAGRTQAREAIAASGIDVCAASIGSAKLLYLPALLRGSGIPYVVGEAADPRVFVYERWQPYEHFGALFAADAVQVLLDEYLPFYPNALRPRLFVIGNPVPPPAEVDFEARAGRETRVIIGVGRFNEEDKRYSLLLRAFALLRGDFPEWRLKLVGDGPYWEFYHIMAEQLGVKDQVEFTGAVSDPGVHYNAADIFCLPSLIAEGLPMVFGEAAAHALPFVGFKSCAASAALITPDIGALAQNDTHGTPEQLAAALRQLMSLAPEERGKIGMNARDSFAEKFGGGKVFGQWEALLSDTLQKTLANGKTALEGILNRGNGDSGGEPNRLEPDIAAEIEIERLRGELARLRQDHGKLGKKYAGLMEQFQTLAGKKKKRR